MATGATRRLAFSLIIPAAAGLPELDAAAVWILGALQHLLRRGQRGPDGAWRWVELFQDLRERVLVIQEAKEAPADCCPLVPVRMPVDVEGWPEPGEAIPAQVEERVIGAIDNRRLAGRVAKLLIAQVALPRSAALRCRQQAQRTGSSVEEEKANGYASQVRDRGRLALRGVDLDELTRAVTAEVEARRSPPGSTDPTAPLDQRGNAVESKVDFVSTKLAVVTEGPTTIRLKGPRTVRVFRTVVQAAGRSVLWRDLVLMDCDAAAEELQRRGRAFEARRQRHREDTDREDLDEASDLDAPATPMMALRTESMQRMGSRIRKALGKLGYHWHQDGRGACWSAETS